MHNLTARLNQSILAAGVPSVGVSIGREDDRSTWTVQPASLQAQAQPIIDAFKMPTAAQLADEDATTCMGDKKILAIAAALWECIPAPTMTKAQTLARAKAIYKTL